MLDEHGKPLPKWRANIRRRLAERGYNIDWSELDRKRKRAAFNLFMLAGILAIVTLLLFASIPVLKRLGY